MITVGAIGSRIISESFAITAIMQQMINTSDNADMSKYKLVAVRAVSTLNLGDDQSATVVHATRVFRKLASTLQKRTESPANCYYSIYISLKLSFQNIWRAVSTLFIHNRFGVHLLKDTPIAFIYM